MRTKVTLVLLLLNVVLFFFIFTVVHRWHTDALWEESRTRVLGPEVATIQSLEISGGRLAEPIHMEKKPDGWMITKPVEWPANPYAVNRILNEMMFLNHFTSFLVKDLSKNGLSLADYGLDKPRITLTFTAGVDNGSKTTGAPATLKTVTLRIGDATKVGNRLYILSPDGERIHVVPRSLADNLSLTLDKFQADTLFNIHLFEVHSFNLQTSAPSNLRIRLRREGARWLFEAPILARADRAQVELAINELNKLHTRSFLDAAAASAPDQIGLTNPAFRLTLEGNGRRETLLLGNPVPAAEPAAAKPAADDSETGPATEYYAKMDDRAPVFTVMFPDSLFAALRDSPEKLRDKHPLSFDPKALSSITLVAPNRPELTLQRLGNPEQPQDTDPWQIVTHEANQAPQTVHAELPLVQRVIEKLGSLQALKFLSDAPQKTELENWGFNRPEREITLNFATKSAFAEDRAAASLPSSVTLLIGVATERNGLAYARRADEPFVYLVDPDILRETPVTMLYYKSRLLRELHAGARITGISLKDIANKTEIFSSRLTDGTTWAQALAGETETKRSAVQNVLEQLETLRAKEFVLDSFPPTVEIAGEMRPWKYSLEATISLVGGTGGQTDAITLFLTERTGGGTQFAGSPAFNVVFEINQKLIDALFTLTHAAREPGPVSPAPAAVDAAKPPGR
jgi:Domain of unknown function (DUF4340)